MSDGRTALVAGATGLVGGHVLRELLACGRYERVVALVRSPILSEHPRLVQCPVAYDALDRSIGSLRADDVFCTLGTTIRVAGSQEAFRRVDLEYPVRLASLTLNNGARQFLIVTSIGADASSRVFYSRTKGEAEEALRRLPFASLQIFRPSLLLGERRERRLTEAVGSVLMQVLTPLMIGAARKYRPIPASVVARAMVQGAADPVPGVHVVEGDAIHALATAG